MGPLLDVAAQAGCTIRVWQDYPPSPVYGCHPGAWATAWLTSIVFLRPPRAGTASGPGR